MPTIEFTDRDPRARGQTATSALARAAAATAQAPSVFTSQPWRWRITGNIGELRADRKRQLDILDPDGRLLTVSCGAALHHARTALAGAGVSVEVARLPEPAEPDLLARIQVTGFATPEAAAIRRQRAMALRRTDRRPFADLPVPVPVLYELRAVAEAEGAHLHLASPPDVVTLAVAAAGGELLDRHARYAVLFTDADTPAAWLAAGEALSAVLLAATTERLAASPVSDVAEVPAARELVRGLLGGIGHPMLALCLGVPGDGTRPAGALRGAPADVVDLEPER